MVRQGWQEAGPCFIHKDRTCPTPVSWLGFQPPPPILGRGFSVYICLAGVHLSLQLPGSPSRGPGQGPEPGTGHRRLGSPLRSDWPLPQATGRPGPRWGSRPLPMGPLPSVVSTSQAGMDPRMEGDEGIKRKRWPSGHRLPNPAVSLPGVPVPMGTRSPRGSHWHHVFFPH